MAEPQKADPPPVEASVFTYKGGQQRGPFSLDEINAQIASKSLSLEDYVWIKGKGWPNWRPASALPGIICATQPPPLPIQSPTLAQTVSRILDDEILQAFPGAGWMIRMIPVTSHEVSADVPNRPEEVVRLIKEFLPNHVGTNRSGLPELSALVKLDWMRGGYVTAVVVCVSVAARERGTRVTTLGFAKEGVINWGKWAKRTATEVSQKLVAHCEKQYAEQQREVELATEFARTMPFEALTRSIRRNDDGSFALRDGPPSTDSVYASYDEWIDQHRAYFSEQQTSELSQTFSEASKRVNYLLQLAKDLPPGLNEDAFRSLVTLLMRLTTWLNCLPTLTPSELTFSGAGKSEIDVLDAFRKGIESFTYALWGKLVPRTDDRIAFATRFVIDHVCGGRDVEKVAEEAGRRAAIVGDEAAEREFYTYISSQREITEKLLSEPGVDSLVSSLANGADALRLGLFHLKFVFDLLTRIAHALANADGIISGEERRFIERLESACGQEIRQREQEEAEAAQPISVEDALADLNKLIGLNDTKRRVTEWARFMKLQVSRKQHGLPTTEPTLHMVFSGNPGTGKTTVARIIGKILKSLKVLEKGHVVECDRSKLVAEYLGQTAVKTNAVIDSALGGVLFIDEAYSLSQVAHFDSYGPEAIQTLLKRMEDDRGKLCVIVAGYTEPMKNFIASNPGLESRFTQFIPFLDFSPEELVAIFTSLAQENGYTCATEVDAELFHYFEFRCAEKDSSFGNARLVRNLFQSVLTAQAERLHAIEKPDRASLEELQISDVRAALAT